jgi:propanol-preferring alcohol dehydrogenase
VEQNGGGAAEGQQGDFVHADPAPEAFDGPGMQTVWLPGSGQVLVQQRPVREPRPGWVRVRVRFSGLSGADLQHYHSPGGHPVVPGHEISGIIDQVGEGVAEFREGDRIIVYAIWGCETCPECLAGEPAACRRPQGMVGVTLDGGDAEYVNVPASTLYPAPDDITDIQAAILGNAIGTPLRALKRMRINPGETIGIFGLGPLGLAVASLASFRGCRVIAVDGNALRLNVARALGAAHAVDSSRSDFRALLDDITAGRGLDYALDASGSEINTNLAMDCARYGGVVGVVGQKDSAPVYPNNRLIRNEITVVGCYYHSRTEYSEIFRLIREGYSPEQIVTHRMPLASASDAFRLLATGQAGKVVLFTELI